MHFVCISLLSISKSNYSEFFINVFSKSKTSVLDLIPNQNNKKDESTKIR